MNPPPPPPKKKKRKKNIHNFIIPPKKFVFLNTPKNIEIQNFEQKKKNGPSLRIYEISEAYSPHPLPH